MDVDDSPDDFVRGVPDTPGQVGVLILSLTVLLTVLVCVVFVIADSVGLADQTWQVLMSLAPSSEGVFFMLGLLVASLLVMRLEVMSGRRVDGDDRSLRAEFSTLAVLVAPVAVVLTVLFAVRAIPDGRAGDVPVSAVALGAVIVWAIRAGSARAHDARSQRRLAEASLEVSRRELQMHERLGVPTVKDGWVVLGCWVVALVIVLPGALAVLLLALGYDADGVGQFVLPVVAIGLTSLAGFTFSRMGVASASRGARAVRWVAVVLAGSGWAAFAVVEVVDFMQTRRAWALVLAVVFAAVGAACAWGIWPRTRRRPVASVGYGLAGLDRALIRRQERRTARRIDELAQILRDEDEEKAQSQRPRRPRRWWPWGR